MSNSCKYKYLILDVSCALPPNFVLMQEPTHRYQLECADECDISMPSYHAAKYRVFRKMVDDQREYREMIESACFF